VHAFEPNPVLVQQLCQSRDLTGFGEHLRITQKAVAARDGQRELFVHFCGTPPYPPFSRAQDCASIIGSCPWSLFRLTHIIRCTGQGAFGS
jgi:hypothetical protein